MTQRTEAELVMGRLIAEAYRDMSLRLRREAFLCRAKGQPLNARICDQYAFIARNAARAEEGHPDTPGFESEAES